MKRLFNHTKRSYEEWDGYDADDMDWDEPAEYEEEYYEDDIESDDTYYEDEELVYSDGESESEGFYMEAGTEDVPECEYIPEDGYYAEEEYYVEEYSAGGEYYTEEEYPTEGEYYTEEEYYAEDEYHVEAENYADGEYYEDEYYEEEEDVAVPVPVAKNVKKKKPIVAKQGFFANLWAQYMNMALVDKIITTTGVFVLIMAIVTGSLYIGTRNGDDTTEQFATVGSQLAGITLIGEEGLLAVTDAEIAKQQAAEIIEEEKQEEEEGPTVYDEQEYTNTVVIRLNMTSVKKDLKIKFINKDTGKLVSNVPFTVTVTDPDGKSTTWEDDDMDGIIYKKDIDGGNYKVLVNELAGDKYKNYTIPSSAQKVEVKKDIVYEKVDVSDEVKTEDEIDASVEDTKVNETVVESTLQDTVEWVESTAVAETYTEVLKSSIPDPTTLALAGRFVRTAQLPDVSGGDAEPELPAENVAFTVAIAPTAEKVAKGAEINATVTPTGATEGATLVYSVVSSHPEVATVVIDQTGKITVTGVTAGTATISATVNYAEGTSLPATASMTVTVLELPVITLDKTTATVYLTEPLELTAKLENALTDAAIVAESSNTSVATVAVTEEKVTITGVAEGEAVITVKYVENGQEAKASCTIKVMAHPKDNKTDKLKDSAGNQLFVLENNEYREAFYADYYTADKFFIKGDVKYTGWQTIDGNVYYFTKTGEKVTGEQVIQGAKYNFASDGSLITGSGTLGIDVSKWNGNIDWQAVKNSGISYVIIRCGYRGSSQGSLIEDPKFTTNIKGAIAAGLKVGVYFFTQAVDEREAVEEASYVLDKIKNYRISYPVFLDVEPSGGRADKIDKATRTAVIKAFCETIQRAGYSAGIYANKTWLDTKMDVGALNSYKIWLAQYAATPTYSGRYDMWQYTATGKVSGISGNVDLNLSYLGY